MERKQMQVYKPIKTIVQDLKKHLKFSNESEVIAYLYAIYEDRYPKITLIENENYLKRVKDILNQQTM